MRDRLSAWGVQTCGYHNMQPRGIALTNQWRKESSRVVLGDEGFSLPQLFLREPQIIAVFAIWVRAKGRSRRLGRLIHLRR